MMAAATLLFGSFARSDHSEGSDTDLLMINLAKETRHVSVGRLSLFLYPWRRLKRDAHEGDLFVCHLVREAKPLFDPDGYLPKLQEAFHFRPDYQGEISRAAEFGWYLAKFGDELNAALLAKRTLWCIRTILIARSAERRAPVFSPRQLAEQTLSVAARDVLMNRHGSHDHVILRRLLRSFLDEEVPSTSSLQVSDRQAFIERFAATSNKVALQTIRQAEQSQAPYSV